MSRYSLAGKVVFVTGGARGIGLETARLAHARGAAVALVDRDGDELERAAPSVGERTLTVTADVTDRAALETAVERTAERFGGVDVPIANAGIAPPVRTMRSVDIDAFERVLDINLLGVWRTVRASLPHVVERRGHVVVVASVYAFMNGVLASPYAITKAGVEQLGRALRVELVPHGASASVAYFGFIDTAMVRDSFSDPVGAELESSFPAFMLRRLQPRDAAQALVSGIERRAPRIVAPRWWKAYMALRGVLNPLLDVQFERDKRLRGVVERGDR